MMRRAVLSIVLLVSGCSDPVGGSSIYLWNGSPAPVEIAVSSGDEGAAPANHALAAGTGKLLTGLKEGVYGFTMLRESGIASHSAVLKPGNLVVFNVDGLGCFSRADVAGMYRQGRRPVRVLQNYQQTPLIVVRDEIMVMPGKGLPPKRTKKSGTFQRVATIPCDIIKDEFEVEAYLTRLR